MEPTSARIKCSYFPLGQDLSPLPVTVPSFICSQFSCQPIAEWRQFLEVTKTPSSCFLPHRLVVAMTPGQPGMPPNLGTGTALMPGAPGQTGLALRGTAAPTTGTRALATRRPTKDQQLVMMMNGMKTGTTPSPPHLTLRIQNQLKQGASSGETVVQAPLP